MGFIYKLTNKVNGKIYIGQTTRTPEKRFIDHIHCKTSVIGKAIDKYKPHNFTLEILEADVPDELLNEREIFWIAFYNSMVPNGYNVAEGGQGNWERTPESIAKMSRKGKRHRDDTRRKIAAAFTGRPGTPHTDESKAKISASTKNKRAVICVETGETFESISAAARANQITVQDVSRACRNPNRTTGGFHWKFKDEPTAENSAASPRKRPVICVETGEVFETIRAAAMHCNIHRQCISRACKDPLKLAGGFHWRYKEVEPQAETESHEQATLSGGKTKPRPVICVETGEVFESIIAAGRHYNIAHKCIARACISPAFTSCGFHWRFKDESESETSATSTEKNPDDEAHVKTGKPLSDEHKARIAASMQTKKPVICVETGVVYESINAAARDYFVSSTCISRACRNPYKTSCGFHWAFKV